MTKYQQIRDTATEMGGRVSLSALAVRVFERGIFTEEDLSGCKMAWVKRQCKAALQDDDPETDLPHFFFIRAESGAKGGAAASGDDGQYVLPLIRA